MKKICNFAVFFLGIGFLIQAQNDCVPGKVYDYNGQLEAFKSLALLDNGDYIAGGSSWSSTVGYYNMYYARIDICGDTIWSIPYGQSYESFVDADIYYKSGDDFAVSATAYYNHITQIYGFGLVKLDLNGDTVWLRTYLNSIKVTGPKDVIQTSDGGFALVGFSQNFPNDYAQIWFIKTDAEGNIEWDRYYGTDSNSEGGEHLMQLPDGGYLILGYRYNHSTQVYRILLIRTNYQGDVLWERLYGNNYFTGGTHIIPVSDGYMLVGTQHPGTTWQTNGDAYVLKTDTFGITQWSHTFGGYYYEQFDKIMQLSDGNFMILGSTSTFGTGGGSPDGWLFKISAEGDSLWSRTYRYETAADRSEYLWDFQPAPDGGFMLAGFCGRVFPNNQDAWVIRTDSLGNPCPPYNGCDWPVGIAPVPLLGGAGVVVYPNPAQNTLQITFPDLSAGSLSEAETSLTLLSLTGQTVLQTTLGAGETSKTISVAHLPEGVYVYTVAQSGAVLARGKVAVVR
ncbi:MAG: T9SS type A sorting domain-containing protein [Sphingobacteriales bacterium]|nr:MAG: T9SS type A sorting domain-containing protein [Sphingobacteriales bacterium]